MYELTKQKSRGYWIIVGIIVFAFITAVLKMAFRESPSTLNDDLVKAANEINAHAPIIVDSTMRLDRVNALPGGILEYNYTLLTLERSQIDTGLLKSLYREDIINKMKTDPKAEMFRENKITIRSKYIDKNGQDIITLSIYPNEYQ